MKRIKTNKTRIPRKVIVDDENGFFPIQNKDSKECKGNKDNKNNKFITNNNENEEEKK